MVKPPSFVQKADIAGLMKYLLTTLFSCCLLAASAQNSIDLQAHRGGRALMPENSIEAMLHAVDLGSRTLELDVVISKDGQVVVSHDTYMNADFMLKPDGSEISKAEQKSLLLYAMPYDSIKKYDGGTKVHSGFTAQKKMHTYKPLLTEMIDAVDKYTKAKHLKPVYYNIEIKCSPKGDNVEHPVPDVIADKVMAIVKQKNLLNRSNIQSFDERPLQYLHAKYPKVVLAYLVSNKNTYRQNMDKLGFKPPIISPEYKQIDATFVNNAHAAGVKVIPWTVNDAQAMKQLAAIKVDGIISDNPDILVELFGSYQKK
ncbi:glycerophosphodiester phosphodiesterase family protein [Mucilaginibacter defluvii]|uniref:Glycerophosphodiester phosphodiesterase family protein n=2 Tax=Mucilaginibacter defluvii TaxID=1196019 RepID=A0ABP9FLI5_9SPHI